MYATVIYTKAHCQCEAHYLGVVIMVTLLIFTHLDYAHTGMLRFCVRDGQRSLSNRLLPRVIIDIYTQ
jgi:hypothetical protein